MSEQKTEILRDQQLWDRFQERKGFLKDFGDLKRQGFKRIGCLGGTFDPFHIGHVNIARRVMKTKNFDCVVFIPAYQNVLKSKAPAPSEERVEIILTAIDNEESEKPLFCSTLELDQGHKMYTYMTIALIQQQLNEITTTDTGGEVTDIELFFIVGTDAINSLHKWGHVHSLLQSCHFTIASRSLDFDPAITLPAAFGEHFSQEEVKKLIEDSCVCPFTEISSTILRAQLAQHSIDPNMYPKGTVPLIREYNERRIARQREKEWADRPYRIDPNYYVAAVGVAALLLRQWHNANHTN